MASPKEKGEAAEEEEGVREESDPTGEREKNSKQLRSQLKQQ